MRKTIPILVFCLLIFSLFTPSAIALNRNDIISQKISQVSHHAPNSVYDFSSCISIIDNLQAEEYNPPSLSIFELERFEDLPDFFNTYSLPVYDRIADIPSRKPNIYFYSDRDLTARVQLAPENAITVSEPAYQPGKGWQAEVLDGSLNGNGDFLFYEALVPDSVWQKKEGYIISAANREQDMVLMLGQYGFNEKETADFIDYWSEYLTDDMDYAFYPQETDAVNRVMPLYVIPEPDEVVRIWFYAEPLVSAPEPVADPEKIVRDGFFVVEWGVMIQDEF